MTLRLENKNALVSGAATGIGRAVALRLAQEGADVAVNHFHQEKDAAVVVHEIAAHERKGIAIDADVSDPSSVERLVVETAAALGDINILVNNAGIENQSPVLELSVEDWDRVLAVNLRGAFLCARRVAQRMADIGGESSLISPPFRRLFPGEVTLTTVPRRVA